jgi:hypothetical protein
VAAAVALALTALYSFRGAPVDIDTRMHQAQLDTKLATPYELNRWGGPDGRTKRWIAAGDLPWYTHPDFYLIEVRPVWSRVVAFCYELFGRSPQPYYVTSLVVFLGFLAVVAVWLRRMLPAATAATATCMFALDALHAESAVWFAGLHSVVGGCFAITGLIAHLRWRQGWRPGLWAALAAWAAALAMSESSLSAFGFVLAFEIVGYPSRPRSILAVVPAALLGVVFLFLLKLAGVGSSLNPLYAEPFHEPARFFSVAMANIPWYFEAAFGGLGLGWAALLFGVTAPWFWTGMRARAAEERRVIWGLLLGSVFSLGPVLGVIQTPFDPHMYQAVRVMLYFSIGLAVFWAVALVQAVEVARRAGTRVWSRIAAAATALVVLANAFVWSPIRFAALVDYWYLGFDPAPTIALLESVPSQCSSSSQVVWLRGPPAYALFAHYHRLAARLGWSPAELGRQLALAPPGPNPLTLVRSGPRTIELASKGAALYPEELALNLPRPLPPDPIQVPGGEIRVLERVDTRPSKIEVTFSGDVATRCFVKQSGDKVELVALPEIGASLGI